MPKKIFSKSFKIQAGFTMVELLVVVTIIAILTTIGITSFRSLSTKGRDAKRIADLAQVQSALQIYYSDHGYYPSETVSNRLTGALSSGGSFTNVTGNIGGTTETKIYVNKLPKSPSGADYTYQPNNGTNNSNCNNDANNNFPTNMCRSYCLYAVLENINNVSADNNKISLCPTKAGYNFAVSSK